MVLTRFHGYSTHETLTKNSKENHGNFHIYFMEIFMVISYAVSGSE